MLLFLTYCSNDDGIQQLKNAISIDNDNLLSLSQILKNDQSINFVTNLFQRQLSSLNPDFKQLLLRQFQVVPESLLSVAQVNQWCSAHTNNKISQIVTDISKIQTLLISAIHFKAPWKIQFDPKLTSRKLFNGFGANSYVDMMQVRSKLLYSQTATAQVVKLLYARSKATCVIILPLNKDSFQQCLDIKNVTTTFMPENVDFQVPKVLLNSNFDFSTALKDLGVTKIFESIYCGDTLGKVLKIDAIIQQCSLVIDEEGTEAAAVVKAPFCCGVQEPEISVICDRPFWIVLEHEGNIIFVASFVK